MSDAKQKKWVEALERWFGRAQNFHAFLVAIFGASVNAAFGIQGDFPPYLVLSLAMGTLVFTTMAYSLAPTKKLRFWFVIGVLGVSAVTALYALHVQHLREAKEYNHYLLEYAGFGEDAVQVPSPPDQPRRIASIQLEVTFDNPNDFPIYTKSVRRTVTINGKSSGDEQEAVEGTVPEHAQDFRVYDTAVQFSPPMSVVSDTPGTIDFTICYGREKGKYTKSYNMKGKLSFPRWADGLPHKPYFFPADNDDRTYGYADECPA